MWDMEPRKVLVAVDSVDCEAALQYAVTEARRRGCGIHLVHVARPALGHSCALDDVCLVEGELRLAGQVELEAAAARSQALIDEQAPDDDRLSVSTELKHGSVVTALQSMSQHAAMLVMEHHGMGPGGETATLSVTAGVAAVAHCPVVAVPDGWRVGARADGSVVVGVEDLERDTLVLHAALHEAARRHARLRVIRAPDLDARQPAEVLDLQHSDVPVDVVVEAGSADQVLLRHAQNADLLVAGRHHRRHMVGAPLGRTVRALLRDSLVPVLVVDPVLGDRCVTAAGAAPSGRG
jgi:nucleotide-binding universal stress UspA family protein